MQRWMRAVGVTVVALVSVAPRPEAAQTSGHGWTVSRTPDGQPDLEGVWANNSVTPLERPDAWAGKTTLTDDDLAKLMAAVAEVTASGLDAQFDNQTTWTRPWTALMPLKHSAEPIFEYACHEGNLGMEEILAGYRADEAAG